MSVRFTFRTALETDRSFIEELRRVTLVEHVTRLTPWDEAAQSKRFTKGFIPSETRIVIVDGEAAGSLSLRRVCHGWPTIELFYLCPEFQNQGLGSAVLTALLRETDAEGVATRLSVLQGSQASRFYERIGYAKTGCDRWRSFYVRYPRPESSDVDLRRVA